ncbi:MAG: hypothetical protein GY820_01445 [Gammaproteobacteria bacterium]|nr:hypothetical protein [Gammaproteobacteria bacterium]
MCPTTEEWRGTGCPLHEGGGGVANRAFANGYPNDQRAASINANAPRASTVSYRDPFIHTSATT